MVLIRPFAPSDKDAVNAVALAAFAQYEKVYSDWDALSRGIGSMADLSASSELLVAEVEGAIAGAVAYVAPHAAPRPEFFEIDWPIIRMLVVDPAERGKGIGRELTLRCIDLARRDSAKVISLHTSPVMAVALSMYLKLGFKLERGVPDRLGVPYGVYLLSI